ncbi:MAG: GNAT family N-acetyltransferase [Clostridium sp.]|nr:GNAT family N-acetyltransferase [Clostridium sp.]
MVSIEKLSLFNIDKFREMYEEEEDSYLCDKGFFDIYDDESFLIKYIIRRQVKLFKLNNQYAGYVWHEYPENSVYCTIYGINFKDEYLEYLTSDMLNTLKFNSIKLDIIQNNKNEVMMHNLGFEILYKSIVMNLDLNKTHIEEFQVPDDIEFKHFTRNKDENLRCKVQNSIFRDKNRVPLKINDIFEEENEDYFIDEFCVFLCNSDKQVLGYGQIISTKNQYTIVNFGILEEFRMHGYGEILLRYLIELCRVNSIYDIYIRVEEGNYKALQLYSKVGFTKCDCCVTWKKDFR